MQKIVVKFQWANNNNNFHTTEIMFFVIDPPPLGEKKTKICSGETVNFFYLKNVSMGQKKKEKKVLSW